MLIFFSLVLRRQKKLFNQGTYHQGFKPFVIAALGLIMCNVHYTYTIYITYCQFICILKVLLDLMASVMGSVFENWYSMI